MIALVTGCASGILVTVFSIGFSLSMARPIKKLTIATNMFANGNFSHRVKLNRRDELGELSRSFNSMADELAQETYKLSRSIEQSPNAVIITDVNGNIEYVNPKFVQMTGYSAKEVIDKNPRILKSGTCPRQKDKELWNTIKAGGEWHGEFQNRKKDGNFYWASVSISAVKDRNGVVKNFIGIQEDITEKKHLQNELRENKESLAHAQHIAHLGSWEWDIHNDTVNCSDESYRIFGLKPQEIVLTDEVFMSFVHPEYKKSVRDALAESIKGKIPDKIEYVIVLPHGNERIIAHEWEVVCDENGNPFKIVGILQDITVKRKMEQELLQSKKIQAMGVMSSGIAHEFNNILAIISGNVQMLMRRNKDQGKLYEELRLILKSCKDGAEIVRRMNEFTRTAEDPKKYAIVNINDLVKNAVAFTKPRWKDMAEGLNIQYILNMEGLNETVSRIKGKSSELREVIVNIIHNALDAMPEGGYLTFSTWEKDDFVFLSISDTGIGMNEEVQSQIFDPFFTSKGIKGMGLGMSLSYGIVKRHRGEIEIKSKVGAGSTFILKFPVNKEFLNSKAC
ncbi:MAG: PAS domain S-box protein [Candidatus Kuenenia sp.]|nr:PAS domain S-box protein [Candidatus Kuenenia hertensis]